MQKVFQFEDAFLIAACLCLVAGTIILHIGIKTMYYFQALQHNSATISNAEDSLRLAIEFQWVTLSYVSLTWTTIFLVKFGFLCMFRHLVERLVHLIRYWRVAVAVTVTAFGSCLVFPFAACPHMRTSFRKSSLISEIPGLLTGFKRSVRGHRLSKEL